MTLDEVNLSSDINTWMTKNRPLWWGNVSSAKDYLPREFTLNTVDETGQVGRIKHAEHFVVISNK